MRFPRSFYQRPTLQVAQDLLGQYLVHMTPYGRLVGEINEVESYIGEDDPASHAFHGRTLRTAPMYGEAGHAYVYVIYGMYACVNVVTEGDGFPAAILIRSVIPKKGIPEMRRLCGKSAEIPAYSLTNGPGKLCRAFGITKEHNELDLATSDQLWIEKGKRAISTFETTARIGITKGTDRLWRFAYTP